MQTSLTYPQKLEALGARFYGGVRWKPKAGDYYTTTRADLELYRVVKIEDSKVYTEYCTSPGILSCWEEEGFTHEGFGNSRVWVHDWILLDKNVHKGYQQLLPGQIESLALQNGFTYKKQEDGTLALHGYVSDFAKAVAEHVTGVKYL